MLQKTSRSILEENIGVTAIWAQHGHADRIMDYLRAHEPGQTALVWALSRVMTWQEAYVACFAYMSHVCKVPAPATITFT